MPVIPVLSRRPSSLRWDRLSHISLFLLPLAFSGWAAPPAQVRPPQPAAPARDPGADFWGEASGGGNNHRAARDPSPEQTQTGGAGLINDFGAAVPPDLLSWCTSELQRIAGSTNDFTGVVSFVYNLQVRGGDTAPFASTIPRPTRRHTL